MSQYLFLQIEDVMIQCIICEDWFHGRVSQSKLINNLNVLVQWYLIIL